MSKDPFHLLPTHARHQVIMRKGDVLFRQDQPTSGLYQVIEGAVTLQRTSLSGDTLTLYRAISGGYFAEASIFSEVYHCDAICTEDGRVLKLAKSAIVGMMRTNPDFSQCFTRMLAIQVQHHRAHIEILAIRSARHRVFAAFQAGYAASTVTELSSRINLTHEACYRALRSLCDSGSLVRIGRGQYQLAVVKNPRVHALKSG